MNSNFTFTTTTKLYFGAGKLMTLHSLPMPGNKALIVTSNGKSSITNGSLDKLCKELDIAGISYFIYNQIGANPTKESIEQGAIICNENGCNFVIALGGGSVLDATKLIALNAANPEDLWNFAMSGTGGKVSPKNPPIKWIAIPTTAGTGSEVDAVGIVTNLSTKEKLGIFSDFATYAIVDPQLMLTIPPYYTTLQGFDTLFHSLEGHISCLSNPFSDMVQEKAIRIVAENLPAAYKDGSNLTARTNMALASTLSGYSMVASSCTAEHAIEHALSAYHPSLPHGAGLIMLCKAYFSTIIHQGVADERFVNMAKWLGKVDSVNPQDFIEALDSLMRKCGVDNLKMSDYGIVPDEFDSMADNAITVMERCWSKDIIPLTHDEIVTILKQSYK